MVGAFDELANPDGGSEDVDFAEAVKKSNFYISIVAHELTRNLVHAKKFISPEELDQDALIQRVNAALKIGVVITVGGVQLGGLHSIDGDLTWKSKDGSQAIDFYDQSHDAYCRVDTRSQDFPCLTKAVESELTPP